MHYKTITLELLQARPQLHEQLRKQRKLLTTLEFYAKELKESHESWTETLGPLPVCRYDAASLHDRVVVASCAWAGCPLFCVEGGC